MTDVARDRWENFTQTEMIEREDSERVMLAAVRDRWSDDVEFLSGSPE